jgi:hypothetical protein
MSGEDLIHRSKAELRCQINRASWSRGIGLGLMTDGRACLVVMVGDLKAVPPGSIPDHVNGVPVRVEEVGNASTDW